MNYLLERKVPTHQGQTNFCWYLCPCNRCEAGRPSEAIPSFRYARLTALAAFKTSATKAIELPAAVSDLAQFGGDNG